MKHVMIAIPCYGETVQIGTFHSILDDLIALISRGDKFTLVDDVGNALIADCRGVIATNFYHSDCDELIFIDSDVSWERGALLKLIDHPVDLVAGVYRVKTDDNMMYNVRWLDKPELWADPETMLLEVEAVATGFMKISRNCITKMIEAHPDQFVHVQAKDGLFYPLFESVIDYDKKFKWGEDYSFCIKWRKLGGQVWVDPEIRMGHTGLKVFEGHLGNWLRNR